LIISRRAPKTIILGAHVRLPELELAK